jgi:hypothetical protein
MIAALDALVYLSPINWSKKVAGIIRNDNTKSGAQLDFGRDFEAWINVGIQKIEAIKNRPNTTRGASALQKASFPATNDVPQRNEAPNKKM